MVVLVSGSSGLERKKEKLDLAGVGVEQVYVLALVPMTDL
jgi:hypothetical protein